MSNIDLNTVDGDANNKANTYLNPRSAQIGEYQTFIDNYLQEEPGEMDDLKKCKEFLKKNILLMKNATGSAKNQLIKIINSLQPDQLLNPKATVPEVAEKCCEATITQKFANCHNGRPICYCCNLPVIKTAELKDIATNLANVANKNKPVGVADVDWKPIVAILKDKVIKELPSRPETEHLQSIAQSTFTQMLPPGNGTNLAQEEIFAFAHSCCNAIKTDMEFISFKYEEGKEGKEDTGKWVINNKAINDFYKELYGLSRADSKNWYWSCYKKHTSISNPYQPEEARTRLVYKLNELLTKLNEGDGLPPPKALLQQKERALFKRMYYKIIQGCQPPQSAAFPAVSSFSKKSSMYGRELEPPSTPGSGEAPRRQNTRDRVSQAVPDMDMLSYRARASTAENLSFDTGSESGESSTSGEQTAVDSPSDAGEAESSDSGDENGGNINFLKEEEINRNFIIFILELIEKNIEVNEEVYDSLYFLLTNPKVTQYIMSYNKKIPTMSDESPRMSKFPYEKISHPPKRSLPDSEGDENEGDENEGAARKVARVVAAAVNRFKGILFSRTSSGGGGGVAMDEDSGGGGGGVAMEEGGGGASSEEGGVGMEEDGGGGGDDVTAMELQEMYDATHGGGGGGGASSGGDVLMGDGGGGGGGGASSGGDVLMGDGVDEAMEEGGGKLELTDDDITDDVCDNLLLFLEQRLYYLKNSKQVIGKLKAAAATAAEAKAKAEAEAEAAKARVRVTRTATAAPTLATKNPYFIFWNVVNLRPSMDIFPPDDKNLFMLTAAGEGKGASQDELSQAGTLAGIIKGTSSRGKKFYQRLARCDITTTIPAEATEATESNFFLSMIAPPLVEENDKSLATQLFVESSEQEEFPIVDGYFEKQDVYYPAIQTQDNKIIFMDQYKTNEKHPRSRRRREDLPQSLNQLKIQLIKQTEQIIKKLKDNKIANEEAKKSKQDDVGKALTNDSPACKEFIGNLCRGFKIDHETIKSWVKKDTSFDEDSAKTHSVSKSMEKLTTPLPIEALAYWALKQPEDINDILNSIKSSTKKFSSKQFQEIRQFLIELQNSSSKFPEPDDPRLENFKFSAMPDGSIYVEEKEEEIADKFNGLKVSEMPDGSFYVELSD